MKIPFIEPAQNKFVISIDGANGAGKSTLLKAYARLHPDIYCQLSIPDIYQASLEMKKYMLYEAAPLTKSLYYLAAAIEVRSKLTKQTNQILLDRSIWSTAATLYAENPTYIHEFLNCISLIKEHILIPNIIFFLHADYETSRIRNCKKTDAGVFDMEDSCIFNRKNEFYRILEQNGYEVHIIAVERRTSKQVLDEFSLQCAPLWQNAKSYNDLR